MRAPKSACAKCRFAQGQGGSFRLLDPSQNGGVCFHMQYNPVYFCICACFPVAKFNQTVSRGGSLGPSDNQLPGSYSAPHARICRDRFGRIKEYTTIWDLLQGPQSVYSGIYTWVYWELGLPIIFSNDNRNRRAEPAAIFDTGIRPRRPEL